MSEPINPNRVTVGSSPFFVTGLQPNLGAPSPGFVPWRPTEAEAATIRAGGRITPAAAWDCATVAEREEIDPALNPRKRWYEQHATVHFPRSDDK